MSKRKRDLTIDEQLDMARDLHIVSLLLNKWKAKCWLALLLNHKLVKKIEKSCRSLEELKNEADNHWERSHKCSKPVVFIHYNKTKAFESEDTLRSHLDLLFKRILSECEFD